jgi:hypothetical protein
MYFLDLDSTINKRACKVKKKVVHMWKLDWDHGFACHLSHKHGGTYITSYNKLWAKKFHVVRGKCLYGHHVLALKWYNTSH